MWSIHCMKLNSPKLRLNTKNQSLSVSSFLNTQNCECWSCTKVCDVIKFEELEKDTDSLYLALAEKELEDCVKPEMRAQWQKFRSKNCVDDFAADEVAKFFPRKCCIKHKQHDKRESGFFKEEFRCTERLRLCKKRYYYYDVTSTEYQFSSKGLNKRVMEQSGDGPLEKYRRALNGKVNVTSNIRGLWTNNQSVSTYDQFKKNLSYFYRKRKVETYGIHTQPLNL